MRAFFPPRPPMPMTLLRSLLSLALAAVTTPLLADTVWLKNGDKLTGSIELFDSGKLLLKTDYAGTITLDAGKIATLESERELLIKQGDFVGERAKSLRAAGQGQVELVNGEAPKVVELSSISQMLPPKPLVQDLAWTGNLSVSADYKQAENDIKDYDIDLDTRMRHGAWRHGIAVEYDHETKDDERKTDLVGFSGLTGDYSELHTSDVYARSSVFGRRVAHGMMGLAYAHGLMWARTGAMRETAIAFLGINDWKFAGPIFVGDTIFVNYRLAELRDSKSKPTQAIAIFDVEVVTHDERVVQRGQKALLVSKVPLAAVEASK